MKINEVETQVGITKKNIRFYEEQGLLSPRRGRALSWKVVPVCSSRSISSSRAAASRTSSRRRGRCKKLLTGRPWPEPQ
mgnify:CR=1 FL=1